MDPHTHAERYRAWPSLAHQRLLGPDRGVPLAEVSDLLVERDNPFGRLTHVAPAARLSETPASWLRPAAPFSSN